MLKICQWVSNNSMYPWYICTGHVPRRDKQLTFDWYEFLIHTSLITLTSAVSLSHLWSLLSLRCTVELCFTGNCCEGSCHQISQRSLISSDCSMLLTSLSWGRQQSFMSLETPLLVIKAPQSVQITVMWPPLTPTQYLNFSYRITFPSLMPLCLSFFILLRTSV